MGGAGVSKSNDWRLFFSETAYPYTQVSPSVYAYLAASFRSARIISDLVIEPSSGQFRDRSTRQKGTVVWIQPFAVPSTDSLLVSAGHHTHGKNAVDFKYQLQRIDGQWVIVAKRETGFS